MTQVDPDFETLRARRYRTIILPIFLYLGPVIFAIGGALLAKQIYFTIQSDTVVGTVMEIKSANGNCHINDVTQPCTKFAAKVEYHTPEGNVFYTLVDDRHVIGHDQPVSRAELFVGRNMEILYDPASPATSMAKTEVTIHLLIYIAITCAGALMYFVARRRDE